MSYDLSFKARHQPVEPAAILDYFRGRDGYKVEGRRAVYSNPDTEVHFVFEFRDPPEAAASFTIDDVQPSCFIREAEPEVAAFLRQFDWIVVDPGNRGMGQDAYDGEGLIAAWTRSREAVLPSLVRESPDRATSLTLPQATLEDAWRWNRNRKTLQQEVGGGKFVPRIMFTFLDGGVSTTSVWMDAIPLVFTPVDYLIVYRKTFAPRPLFKRPTPDWALIAWKDALEALGSQVSQRSPGAFEIGYKNPPPVMRAYVSGLKSLAQCPPLVAADKVLDREAVERALAAL